MNKHLKVLLGCFKQTLKEIIIWMALAIDKHSYFAIFERSKQYQYNDIRIA